VEAALLLLSEWHQLAAHPVRRLHGSRSRSRWRARGVAEHAALERRRWPLRRGARAARLVATLAGLRRVVPDVVPRACAAGVDGAIEVPIWGEHPDKVADRSRLLRGWRRVRAFVIVGIARRDAADRLPRASRNGALL